MSQVEYPEFFLHKKLLHLIEDEQDAELKKKLSELETDIKEIISENSIYAIQMSMVYSLLGDELYPETKNKLKIMYKTLLAILEDE